MWLVGKGAFWTKDLEIFLPGDNHVCPEMVLTTGACHFVTNGHGFTWLTCRNTESFDWGLKRQVQERLFSVFLLLLSPLLNNTKLPGFMFHWAAAAGLMFFSPHPPPSPPPVPPPPLVLAVRELYLCGSSAAAGL